MNATSRQKDHPTDEPDFNPPGEGALKSLLEGFSYASFQLRAVGKARLVGARIFRSCELKPFSVEDANFLVEYLGINMIYDLRNEWEVHESPEPLIPGVKTLAFYGVPARRSKDVSMRLRAGIIGEYGAPEARMINNYRLFASNPTMIAKALAAIAEEESCLVHCVHGKDRTGVLCAVLLKICGAHNDDIMRDYLATNMCNAEMIVREMDELGEGMDSKELAILSSFLEARPSYLEAFFNEINIQFGNFENYLQNGLFLNRLQREKIVKLLNY